MQTKTKKLSTAGHTKRLVCDGLVRLEELARGVPEHIAMNGWNVNAKPSFGQHVIYADNGKGQGRQIVAHTHAGKKYFGTLHEYIAACDPKTILGLIAVARRAKA